MIEKSKEFKEWAKDMSRAELVKDTKFFGNTVLMEVFSRKAEGEDKKVDLIVEDTRQQGKYKRKKDDIDRLVEPLAKVLAVGNNLTDTYKGIEVGDVIILPDDIKNVTDNPDFVEALKTSTGSNNEVKIASGLRRSIRVFNNMFDRFRYQIEKMAKLKSADVMTYVIPLHEGNVIGVIKREELQL